jgi:hypothetical protein
VVACWRAEVGSALVHRLLAGASRGVSGLVGAPAPAPGSGLCETARVIVSVCAVWVALAFFGFLWFVWNCMRYRVCVRLLGGFGLFWVSLLGGWIRFGTWHGARFVAWGTGRE